jgi:flagellar hook capping protein FlgD
MVWDCFRSAGLAPSLCSMILRRSAWARVAALGAAAAFLATTAGPAPASIPPPPGGPILVVTSSSDGFGRYLPEILRAEGLNEFDVADVGQLSAPLLASHGVVVLGPTGLSGDQVATLTAWVQGGGNLVAMRPAKNLAGLLGLADAGATLSDASITATAASGVTTNSMQFHGTADLYGLNGASAVATFSDAGGANGRPAVSLRSVGAAGGQAAAFAYDLGRSVVYTRQGNPAWIGQERDNQPDGILRSDDMFFPDWVDLGRVQVPSADEQQRLFANLVIGMQQDRMPLPRFWYLPRGLKAAVVLTGDDHANNGTEGQFNRYRDVYSQPGCSVDDWQCVRSTSYLFPTTDLADAKVASYKAAGFEIALHLWSSGTATGFTNPGDQSCHNFLSAAAVGGDLDAQIPQFTAKYPSAGNPATNRDHCIVWSGWADVPKAELAHGIRFDTNYYYWPGSWVLNRPGFFTGSGFPMRFADYPDGSLIDVYQATTQLTDESGQNIATEGAALLDNAVGSAGYYGVITANMHTDISDNPDADTLIGLAQARGVPVVSARQMLTWLDGRDQSSFGGLSMSGGRLSFSIAPGSGARGLQAMLPIQGPTGALQALARDGQAVSYATQTIKGIAYATFAAGAGSYVATYPAPPAVPGTPAPVAGTAASKQATIRAVQVLPHSTKAPTFPRLKLSTLKLRLGAGRSLAITFRLKHSSRVVLTIRNAKGKIVRRIRAPKHKAHTVLRLRWDGRDSRGHYVAPGRYSFTLTATGSHYRKTARGSVRVVAAT